MKINHKSPCKNSVLPTSGFSETKSMIKTCKMDKIKKWIRTWVVKHTSCSFHFVVDVDFCPQSHCTLVFTMEPDVTHLLWGRCLWRAFRKLPTTKLTSYWTAWIYDSCLMYYTQGCTEACLWYTLLMSINYILSTWIIWKTNEFKYPGWTV